MLELDHKEGWASKNWCFWTVVLENTLESSLDCKKIKPVHPKGNQSWIFIKRTDAEAEIPILWPPNEKSWLIRKDPDAGKDWRQEKKGLTDDEMAGWHHWFDRHEFEQALGVGDWQGSLACYNPWGHKKLDMTEWLNWTELMMICWFLPCRRFFIFIFSFMPLDFKSTPFPIPELWRSYVMEECSRVFF